MTTSNRYQVVLNKVVTDVSGSGYTHKTLNITKTATMKNGSLLIAAGTEAAIAGAANVVFVIDSPEVDSLAVGATLAVSVAHRNVVLNTGVLKFSDGTVANTALLTSLKAAGVEFSDIKTV